MITARHHLLALLAALCAGSGCVAEELETSSVEEAVSAENGLSSNALGTNALGTNALGTNALGTNALGTNALGTNGILLAQLTPSLDANAALNQELMKYVVGCALPAGQGVTVTNLDGQTFTWWGRLGLAPEWATGPLDVTGQEWVSACLMARTNAYGIQVQISLRGPTAVLDTTAVELGNFTAQEGAFFGNVFESPARLYTCYGSASSSALAENRVCTSGGSCGFVNVGACPGSCQTANDDTFRRCAGGSSTWHRPITTYVDPASPLIGGGGAPSGGGGGGVKRMILM